MQFKEFTPIPALHRVVARIWELESSHNAATSPAFDCLVPDGNAELVIHLRSIPHRQINGQIEVEPSAFVFGQLTAPLLLSSSAETLTIGVSLRPEALARVTACSGHDLTNRAIALEDLWGPFGLTLRQQLLDAPSTKTRVEILQHALLARIRNAPFEAEAEAQAVALIRHHRGVLTTSEVAAGVGMSLRQLQRRFNRTIGVSPKTFIRIARFRAVIRWTANGDHRGWAGLAADLGFTDQAHLIKEFRRFAGGEPPVSFALAGRRLALAFAARLQASPDSLRLE